LSVFLTTRPLLPLAPLLYQMERAGLKVDRGVLAELSNYLGQELHKLTVKIYQLAGREFNIGSPKQVGDVLGELDDTEDPKPVFDAVQSLLVSHQCRVQSSSLYEDKGRMVFLLYLPTGVDPTRLEHEVRSKLRKNRVSKIAVDVV